MIYSISTWNNIPHWILLWHTTIVYTNIYGRISKALHGTKVARYKRVHPLWSHLYKCLEKYNSLIARENKEEWGSFWCDENFLTLDGDGGYWSEHILPYFLTMSGNLFIQISGQAAHFLWNKGTYLHFKGLIGWIYVNLVQFFLD